MRSIFLTVVVVCALGIAGIGGVFANYQDIDISSGNYVETGDLDLKVSDAQGTLWDTPNIPSLVYADNFMPECTDKSFHFDLHNAGTYEQGTGYVYMHIKNLTFEDTGRTEPEDAVELGLNPIGELPDGTTVALSGPDGPPNGPLGEFFGTGAGGELADHLRFHVYTSVDGGNNWVQINLNALDANDDGEVKLSEVVCNQIFISELDSQADIDVKIDLWLQDIPEEALEYDLFPAGSPWSDWPTNGLQNDKVIFDISFELFQFLIPPA